MINKSAHTTLLIVEANRLVRADIAGTNGSAQVHILQQPRSASNGLVDSVKHTITLDGPLAKNTWVASEEIWSQIVDMPPTAVSGLKANELQAALAFEAEPLSGISPANAVSGVLPMKATSKNSSRQFAYAALDKPTREAMQSLIEKNKGTFRGAVSLRDLPAGAAFPDERDWIKACLARINQLPAVIPIVPAEPRKISPWRFVMIGLALEAAMLLICFVHWKWLENSSADAEATLKSLREPKKLFEETKKKITASKVELLKLMNENKRLAGIIKNASDALSQQRGQVSSIMDSLAKVKPEDVALTSITRKDNENMRIEGMSLDPAGADIFASKLELALDSAGLRVQPISKAAQGLASNGGPWKFSMLIGPEIVTKVADVIEVPAAKSPQQKLDRNVPLPKRYAAPKLPQNIAKIEDLKDVSNSRVPDLDKPEHEVIEPPAKIQISTEPKPKDSQNISTIADVVEISVLRNEPFKALKTPEKTETIQSNKKNNDSLNDEVSKISNAVVAPAAKAALIEIEGVK